MEYVFFAAAMLLILFLLMLKGYLDDRKNQKQFTAELYGNYGVLPEKTYDPVRFQNIPSYFKNHKADFQIDDITWNDLNMDEIFMKMNYTMSAAGEEYLYYTLRTPEKEQKELDRKEEVISYFAAHPDERVACQLLFQKLGGTGKYSIYDYLNYLDDLGERDSKRHYLALCLVLTGISVIFVNLPLGFALTGCIFIANIISYFKEKNEIDPYITSFSYIFRLLDMVEQLKKEKIAVLARENEVLEKAARSFWKFKRGSFLLMSPGRMSASSNFIEILLDYLRMVFHLDLIQFNRMLKEVRSHTKEIDNMLTIVGRMDAMIAVGAFRQGNQSFCIPKFAKMPLIRAKQLYHPLIEKPVKNDFQENKSVLITGSNASGKSTFLKTVAVNAILAQTIHTCLADSFETGLFRIYSSMTLRDDIQGGDSYYMAEVRALKRILDAHGKEGLPVLCFVDEVLRGTNTVERIAASAQILKSLCQKNCLCFAATHDIELTHLLKEQYANYHFEEEIAENDIFFSYKIISGRAASRNAIKLLHIMGYEDKIVTQAERMAANFVEKGDWTC